MLDFEIQKFTRRCAASDRELRPGETFYSVLVPRGADVVRLDYAVDTWSGAPADALGWWRAEVPDPRSPRVGWAPSDVMLHYFQRVLDQPAQRDLCYVLTLLMIRRRIFKLEASETDDAGREVLTVYCPRTETEYRVPVQTPAAERITTLQEQLAQMLFAEGR